MIGDDIDWEDRNVAPVFVTNEDTGYSNKLNHQMDHMWDGFYTGQKHKQQYTAQIYTRGNYTVEYTSTPFKLMRYELRAARGQIKLKIHYWNAGSYEVYANGKKMDPTPWDKEAGRQSELTGYRGCGENRYVGVENYLEFMMTPWCLIEVKPVDAIVSNVRMAWTMAEFYASGGPTSFVDRVSASLGIHASQMKVVAVYTGSVVVDYEITPDSSSSDSEKEKRQISANLNTLIASGNSEVFGAPVLSASTDGEAIVEDPTYNPAARPAPQTTPVESNEETITIDDGGLKINLDESTRNSLIGILVVVIVLIGCCFGCGALLICSYQMSKAANEITDVKNKVAKNADAKKKGLQNASESQIDIDQQYVLPDNLDVDLFTSKKRALKVNQEELGDSGRYGRDSVSPLEQTNAKLMRKDLDTHSISADLTKLTSNKKK